MKAVIYKKYGPPENLQFVEIDKPLPKENEVLIKVHASSLNAFDWHMLTADIFFVRLFGGLTKPRTPILGADVAGTVEAIGSSVVQFKPGDTVFGDLAMSGNGTLCEYTIAPENRLHKVPKGVSLDDAAAVPMAGVTALQALREQGNISKGKKVLINGASGGVGTFAIQLAKVFEAEVTAVCSTQNQKLAKDLGADFTIDYKKEDFTKNEKKYDIILGVNGYHPLKDYRDSLTDQGVYVAIGGSPKQMSEIRMQGPFFSSKKGKKFTALFTQPKGQDLEFLISLIKEKKIKVVIDKKFKLHEIIEAFHYLGKGHAQGKVIVNVN
ncbi:MAG: NAD(P)-dependent alcohol dehydrogenase [Spirochaetales bacterium]|nr:NAD(P)-dependent alcohol dehydrogenase [Spirochaetales bacterium]